MKVFFDTNVWLSAIVFPGLCAELLLQVQGGEHELISSELVRQEVHQVLRRKFARHAQALTRFDSLWACARCVPDVTEPIDDADARLVASAVQAGAELFVTGDQRVQGWGAGCGILIVAPRQAWTLLQGPGSQA